MVTLHVCHDPLDDHDRASHVFAGDLMVFTAVPGLAAFRDRVDEVIRDMLGTNDPETAQVELEKQTYAHAVQEIQRRVRTDTVTHRLLLTALENTGVDLSATYWDWIHLRILPHTREHSSAQTGWHRDTWSSNVHAQTNWWTPIYPLTPDRCLRFAPQHWAEPVANTSRQWRPPTRGANQRPYPTNPPAQPLIPEPMEDLTNLPELRVVIAPGDLLCFSGAHLHSTVPNTSGLTRFSIEVRTVHQADIDDDRAAPNIDADASTTRYGWFHHVLHGRPLVAPSQGH